MGGAGVIDGASAILSTATIASTLISAGPRKQAGLAGKSMCGRGLVKTIIEVVAKLSGLEIVALEQEDYVKALEPICVD